jgi:hypothetical protein
MSGEGRSYDPWPENLCRKCGWDLSSHGSSHGPRSDCPWGVSPAGRAGVLAHQIAVKSATPGPRNTVPQA